MNNPTKETADGNEGAISALTGLRDASQKRFLRTVGGSSKDRTATSNTLTDLSETGLADVFVATRVNIEGLKWVDDWGRWMQWDGQVWGKDRTVAVFDKVRSFLQHWTDGLPSKEARSLCSAATVSAVERLSRVYRSAAAVPEDFDADPWLLNTPDGVVDLNTGQAQPHDPMLYMSKITAVGPGGQCFRWLEFLDQVTDGDEELREFLQRLAGYCLSGSVKEHAFVFFWGTGGNGKGVFLNTLRGVIGDYAKIAPIETFTETSGDRHPTELAMLQGARLVIAQETEEGRRWSESKIKTLTGGDPISARFMRRDFFEYWPQFKLVIAGNHKPSLATVDEAMRRRLHLVPFTVTIPPEKRDPDLTEKLREEWPGILKWAIAGCLSYLDRGLDPPQAVTAATADYFEGQDSFRAWLEERCETHPGFWEPAATLFKSWKDYAEANGLHPGSQKSLAARLEAGGFTKGRNRGKGRHWKGLKVADHGGGDGW